MSATVGRKLVTSIACMSMVSEKVDGE